MTLPTAFIPTQTSWSYLSCWTALQYLSVLQDLSGCGETESMTIHETNFWQRKRALGPSRKSLVNHRTPYQNYPSPLLSAVLSWDMRKRQLPDPPDPCLCCGILEHFPDFRVNLSWGVSKLHTEMRPKYMPHSSLPCYSCAGFPSKGSCTRKSYNML